MECVILMIPLGVFLFLSFQTAFVLGGGVYLDHHLYRSLLCMAQGESAIGCKRKLIKKSSLFFLKSGFKNIQLKKEGQRYFGSLLWNGGLWKLRLKRTLKIPEDLLL